LLQVPGYLEDHFHRFHSFFIRFSFVFHSFFIRHPFHDFHRFHPSPSLFTLFMVDTEGIKTLD